MPRKRKPGKRTKSGRLSTAIANTRDNGTAEVQAKRRAMVGDTPLEPGGKLPDPALSASAPGILFAHGVLDREQFDQAMIYRRLRSAVYGSPWPTNVIGPDVTDKRLATLQRRLAEIEARVSQAQRHVVAQVAVFDHIPQFFYCTKLKLKHLPEDIEYHSLLITGLDAMLDRRSSARAA